MQPDLLLNVDDHEACRYARTRLLKDAGYAVEEAGTGEEALALAAKLHPSLILLDVHLPDISGLDVCRRLKQRKDSAYIPILQISASAITNPHRVIGLDSGADCYVVEPVDSDVLLATIRALLRMRHAEQELVRVNAALQESNLALEEANAALLQSNEDLRRFSYVASHDLQEPLRTIRSFAALLNRRYRSKMDETADEYLRYIDSATARMSSLISDLLVYAQVSEKTAEMSKAVNIESVIDAAMANLEQALRESSTEIVRDSMPIVPGDEGQLIQLFQNLIGNAIKYRSPDQTPVVRIQAEKHPEGNWLFAVRDNGVGIAPKHREEIFAAFKRLHGREVPGTGIGLASCRRIVERHGGRIWVESAGLGCGATFLFTLPREQ